MTVVREISKEPKSVKCGESADYLAAKVIESDPYAFDDWRPYTAEKKARNDIDRYVAAAENEVTRAAKDWVDSVQCKGKSEACPKGKCRKDIKLRTGAAEVAYFYTIDPGKRGYVVCTAVITSDLQTVHCNCAD